MMTRVRQGPDGASTTYLEVLDCWYGIEKEGLKLLVIGGRAICLDTRMEVIEEDSTVLNETLEEVGDAG
jgi:hypothetical protein